MRLAATCALLGLAAVVVSPAARAQAGDAVVPERGPRVPRTAWGDPDLAGRWPLDHVAQTPLERSVQFGTRGALSDAEFAELVRQGHSAIGGRAEETDILRNGVFVGRGEPLRQTSLIVEPADGRFPALTEAGQRLAAAHKTSWNTEVFDRVEDFGNYDRCITRGMPDAMLPAHANSGIELHQAPAVIAFRLEMIHETRLVHLDGRAPPPAAVTYWLGYSQGHWEGDALMIETTNFTPGGSDGPVPTSGAMHMVERLTPTGPDTIRYEAWITDPVVLTGPYKLDFPWRRDSAYRQYEYACHEGNYAIRDTITSTGTRFAGRRGAAQAASR